MHQSGKKAKKFINETTSFLSSLFSISLNEFDLIYHSGASEGINSIFKGLAFRAFSEKRKICFYFSHIDHACVFNLKADLEILGHVVKYFPVDSLGQFNLKDLVEDMLISKDQGYCLALNYTYINNETGVCWPLNWACEIKKATGSFVHVDAVQLVGKIHDWKSLESSLDSYTFSGHKFGSLKGVGFSFIKSNAQISPLIVGGNQQQGYRAGTENSLGIYSLKLALEDFIDNFDASELKLAKEAIEKKLVNLLGNKGRIIAAENKLRNLNTIFFLIYGKKAESLSAHFDLNFIDVSTGSACASGVIKENRVLMSMGFSSDDSRSAIRLSFSPFMNRETAEINFQKIETVLSGILKS